MRSSEPHPLERLFDLLLVALNPCLIMVMVGSLVFFLLQLTCDGEEFSERIQYVFGLFVFATVLIARISIEEGNDRALPFGLALAGAVALVLTHFHLNLLLVILFVPLVWWSAHRLTWDCTVLENDRGGPGEGLFKSLGWDEDQEALDPLPKGQDAETLEGPSANGKVDPHRWWKFIVGTSERPHAPGTTILLFALAALPLFGVGNLFLPLSPGDRRFAFGLFCSYLASGLGLLVTTSLLSLRRYLRRRKIDITSQSATTWLATGAVLTLLVMGIATLLPRPGAEYAISRPPAWPRLVGQPSQDTTRWALGKEGWQDGDQADRTGTGPPKTAEPDTSDETPRGQEPEQDGPASDQGHPHVPSQSGSPEGPRSDQQAGGASRDQASGVSQDQKSKSSEARQTKPNAAQPPDAANHPKETETTPSRSQDASRSEEEKEGSDQRSAEHRSPPMQDESSTRRSLDRSSESEPAPSNAPPPPNANWSLPQFDFANALHWLVHVAFWVAVAWLAWRSRETIIAAFRELWESWLSLWGRKRSPTMGTKPAESIVAIPQRRFSDFQNPFSLGRGISPMAIVRTTVEAVEAWAAERGAPRPADQTWDEFSRQLSASRKDLANDLQILLQLHSQLAYAGQAISTKDVLPLRRLWSRLGGGD